MRLQSHLLPLFSNSSPTVEYQASASLHVLFRPSNLVHVVSDITKFFYHQEMKSCQALEYSFYLCTDMENRFEDIASVMPVSFVSDLMLLPKLTILESSSKAMVHFNDLVVVLSTACSSFPFEQSHRFLSQNI